MTMLSDFFFKKTCRPAFKKIKKNIRPKCVGLSDPDELGHQARVPGLFWQVFFIFFFNYFYSLFRCKKKLRKKIIRPG
jgi:hypothetical protein